MIYKNLHNVAQISALFYLEEDELNTEEFEKVKKQFEETVSGIDYQVYNQNNRIDYGQQDEHIPATILNKIREQKQSAFRFDNDLCFGIFYEDNQGDFVIVAKDDKEAIALPGTKDELEDLTNTFNELLSAIEETIVIQRNFVNYVSHEFKTPLASLLGNLEVFSIKDRSPEEYRQLSEKLIRQVNQMEEILYILMVVSDLKKEVETGEQTRLDELVWKIIDKVTGLYPHADIRVKLNILPEDEHLLSVSIERTQLLLMLFNLVENAVKYSQGKPVAIAIFNHEHRLCLSIADQGIGIMPEHLADISKSFYRADHTNRIEGSGIGLSIALRIMEKNGIAYEIKSEVNIGTTVFVKW